MSTPSQAQAHVYVAAIRVLEHQAGRPPSVEEIAQLLSNSIEVTGHVLRTLEKHGIITSLTGPFELRVQVLDHLEIEKLPVDESSVGFKNEVDEFHRRFEERQDQLQNLFDSKEMEDRQKKKLAGLEQDLKDFQSPRPSNPFVDDTGESS